MNRLDDIIEDLVGTENPDDLMQSILEVLKETQIVPDVGEYYTFVYSPKTPNIHYDQYPLVGVTDIFRWGFRGINFHLGDIRQYTWNEVVGQLHKVSVEEFKDLSSIPYQKLRLNS